MTKVTITQIDFYDKKKDGTALTYMSKKDNRPHSYKKVRIKTGEEGDLWGAVFSQQSPINQWKAGDVVEVDIKPNGDFKNFELPKTGVSRAEFESLEKRVAVLEEFTKGDEQEINAEDIPF